jgi:hypothetical protein
LGLIGFIFYGFINDEITEFNENAFKTLDINDLEKTTVEKESHLKSYAHRVSTYEQPSNDLLKAYLGVADEADFSIGYFDADDFILEEWMNAPDSVVLRASHVIILGLDDHVESTIPKEWIQVVTIDEQTAYVIEFGNNGLYQLRDEHTRIEFDLKDYR